jgi:hypothetical protein
VPRRRGLRLRLLAAVIRSNATLAFAAERQVVGQTQARLVTNRFGLSRDVPDPIQRQVRGECGFACVGCGALGMHYDHFAPEFVDCQEHIAAGIALLCPTCHQDRTSGRLSADRVEAGRRRARELWKDPALRTQFSGDVVTLAVGSNRLTGPSVGLCFGSFRLLEIQASGDDFQPWVLSGAFVHGAGHIARFDRNTVVACSGNWDVQLSGHDLTFRAGPADIVLQLGLFPTELRIQRLDLRWPSGVRFTIDNAGTICMENLRNTATNTSAGRIVLRDNLIVAAQTGPAAFNLVNIDAPGGHIGTMEFGGNRIFMSSGVADLSSLLSLRNLLSEDQLDVGAGQQGVAADEAPPRSSTSRSLGGRRARAK